MIGSIFAFPCLASVVWTTSPDKMSVPVACRNSRRFFLSFIAIPFMLIPALGQIYPFGKEQCNLSRNYPSRRHILKAGFAGGLLSASLPALLGLSVSENDPFELSELTIADLHAGMQSGKYTARSLAQKYLARIEAIDKQGPALRSVIEVNPDALALADELDKERKEKRTRGTL